VTSTTKKKTRTGEKSRVKQAWEVKVASYSSFGVLLTITDVPKDGFAGIPDHTKKWHDFLIKQPNQAGALFASNWIETQALYICQLLTLPWGMSVKMTLIGCTLPFPLTAKPPFSLSSMESTYR
jgi:hypothetical protein